MSNQNNTKTARTKTNYLLTIIYFLCIMSVSIYAFEKPYYNWDALPYMAVALSYESDDAKFIHDTVYAIAKEQMPSIKYEQIIDTSMDYKKRMLQNTNDFYNLLPFYVVKPLYTGMIYLFYKGGISLLKATVLPSVVAYVLLGWLLFMWMKNYLPILFACLIALLIMLSAPVLEVVKTSSPDCLASFLLLMAFYFIIERKSLLIAFLFLLFSVFARLDDIIQFFFILSLLAFTHKWKEKLVLKNYFAMVLVIVVAYFLITSFASKFNWGLLYYPSFAKHLNLSYQANTAFSFKDYLALSVTHIVSGFFFTHFIVFMLLALIVFINKSSTKFSLLNFEQSLLLVIFLSIAVRFILQPIIADRFYVAYYLLIIILLVKKITGHTELNKE
jgi:hypothetical protein